MRAAVAAAVATVSAAHAQDAAPVAKPAPTAIIPAPNKPVVQAPTATEAVKPAAEAAKPAAEAPKPAPATAKPAEPAPKKTTASKPAAAKTADAAAKPAPAKADAAKSAEPAAKPDAAAAKSDAAKKTDASAKPAAEKSADAKAKAAPAKAADAAVKTDAATKAADATNTAPAAVAAPAVKAAVPEAMKPATGAESATPVSQNPEAEAVWREYEKRWSETDDYAAGFRQTIEVPDVGTKVESAGRFYFAKPGLVRWEYTEGPPQTVVGDGAWLWLYQPDLEQVYKIAYAKAFGRGGLVELLAGRQGVSERYRASLVRPDAATVRILLKSLGEGGGNLEVTLASDTFDLRAVTVHDAAGSITRMTFAEPLRNRGIDRDRFTFTPPPAVDIISDNEAAF